MKIKIMSFKNKKSDGLGKIFYSIEIILSMVIASIVKTLSPSLSIELILLARYIFCLPGLFAFGFLSYGQNVFSINNYLSLGIRITAGFLGLLFWFLAISRLYISTATVLLQLMVFFTVFLAYLILGERTGVKKWIAILVGFTGTIILINPNNPGWDSVGLIYGLAAPISAAFMFIYLRKLGKSERIISAALWYNLVCAALLFFWYVCFCSWEKVSTFQFFLLGCVGLTASFQQASLALSHKYSEASELAPLNYFSIPLALIVGYVIFDDNLGINFFVGTSIILLSAYYISNQKLQH